MQVIYKIKSATRKEVFNDVYYGLTIMSILFAMVFILCVYADAFGLGGN